MNEILIFTLMLLIAMVLFGLINFCFNIATTGFRRKLGYTEEDFFKLMSKHGILPDISGHVLRAFRECSTKDFLVNPKDKIESMYGISGYDDTKDFIEDLAAAAGRKIPEEEVPTEKMSTVLDVAIYINKLPLL